MIAVCFIGDWLILSLDDGLVTSCVSGYICSVMSNQFCYLVWWETKIIIINLHQVRVQVRLKLVDS